MRQAGLIEALKEVYGVENFTYQKKRFNKLLTQFNEVFSDAGYLSYFSTPGRTEIGGNHTDHNQGRVLAASVNLDSIAIASKNDENKIVLFSAGYKNPFIVNLAQLDVVQKERETTFALIRGIAARFRQLGYKIGGFSAYMTSKVLPGSGLSSSASVEVLIASILNTLYNDNCLSPRELAKIGQYAENKYFGKPCGLMDQLACAVGGIITIDFQDPVNPNIEQIDFDLDQHGYAMIIVNTGESHANLTSAYASVPAEMKAVAKSLGTDYLRSLEVSEFTKQIPDLRDKVGDRAILRSMHFFDENKRVGQQVDALKHNDIDTFLELINESGNSSYKWLQNIYSGQNPKEQGVALALALSERYLQTIGSGAARVHGGGFAGTIQVFVPKTHVDRFKRVLAPVFGEKNILALQISKQGAVFLNPLV
jgi:galactokinase